MRLLFVTRNPFLPQLHGGMQSSGHELCRALHARGHHVAVLAGFMGGSLFAHRCKMQMKILRRKISKDRAMGYPVWRAWYPWEEFEYVIKKERPDLIVVMAAMPVRMALAAQRTRTPLLIHLQDVEFHLMGGSLEDLGKNVHYVANSHFTAEKFHRAHGIHSRMIYPFIEADRYRTRTTRENVALINPHALKGVDIALGVARHCPEIPFNFVEAWELCAADRRELMENLAALPNVSFLPPQDDMRRVYRKCKILLAPSRWEEAYGRVATEAQISGIPVVASRRGGLPEAVGPGGVLLDPHGPLEDWVRTVRKLWLDNQHYGKLSAAARAHAERPENSFSHKLTLWEEALSDACGASLSASANRNRN